LVAERSAVDQPAVEAMMVYCRGGELFEKAGKLDEAERAFDRAVAVHERRTAHVPSDPDDPYICQYVAQWNFLVGAKRIGAGRMKDAAELYARALAVDPDKYEKWCEAAALYLLIGDVERYRSTCREILDRFEKSSAEAPDTAARSARSCTLARDSVPDFSRVERLAERGVAGTEHHVSRRYFVFVKGLTEHRAGRHDQAVRWLEDFGPRPGGTHLDAATFAALAMARHRLGQAEQARASLAAARSVLARKPDDAMNGGFWSEWLHCQILCREAEQMLAR
jgi:tetratricopeptide (TPR) repeat protein